MKTAKNEWISFFGFLNASKLLFFHAKQRKEQFMLSVGGTPLLSTTCHVPLGHMTMVWKDVQENNKKKSY